MSFPKGYFTLFSSEFGARFSFWGVQSVFVIFLTKQFLLPDATAYKSLAVYSALTYMTTFVGGILADKYFGSLKVLLAGIVLSAFGVLLLLLPAQSMSYYGLGMLVVGMGLYVPANTSILDNLYEKNDPLRDRGYFYLYVATNLGGICGPIIMGLLAQYYSFKAGFIFCGLMLLVMFLSYFVAVKRMNFYHMSDQPVLKKPLLQWTLTIATLLALIYGASHLIKQGTIGLILGIGAACAVAYFGSKVRHEEQAVKKNITVIVLFSLLSLLFFAMEFQLLNSVITFTRDYIDRDALWFSIPVASFVSLQPLFVVILAPIATVLLEKTTQYDLALSNIQKFSLSFLFLSLSFLSLSEAANHAYQASQLISPLWLIMSTCFMSAGEVLLMPVLLALITKEAPENMKNGMVGFLYFCLSFASYLAGSIANLIQSTGSVASAQDYSHVYWSVFLFALGSSIVLWLLHFYQKQRLSVVLEGA